MRKTATEQVASSAEMSSSSKPEPSQSASHLFCSCAVPEWVRLWSTLREVFRKSSNSEPNPKALSIRAPSFS